MKNKKITKKKKKGGGTHELVEKDCQLSKISPISKPSSFGCAIDGEVLTFERGMVDLPPELSKNNYLQNYWRLYCCGMRCNARSAPMRILGSTIGASGHDFMWKDDAGVSHMVPRLKTYSRPNTKGFRFLRLPWMVNLAK